MCFFIDYLVLKTGWSDEQVLGNAHHSNKRKFDTYKAMDMMQSVTPLTAYPIISDDGNQSAMERVRTAQAHLFELMGLIPTTGEPTKEPFVEDDEVLQSWIRSIEQEVGGQLVDINDILAKKKV